MIPVTTARHRRYDMTPEQDARAKELNTLLRMHDIQGAVNFVPVAGCPKSWRIIYYPRPGGSSRYIYFYTFEGLETGVHRLIKKLRYS